MPADGYLELRPCSAGLDALVPRVTKLGFSTTPAVSEPRTAPTATTAFSRFLDGTAFAALVPDDRRCDCWYLYVNIGQRNKEENSQHSLFRPAVTCYWP